MNLVRDIFSCVGALTCGMLDAIDSSARKRLRCNYIPDYSSVCDAMKAAEDSSERVFDARNEDAIALLKVDPDAFFRITKRQLPDDEYRAAVKDALRSTLPIPATFICDCGNEAHESWCDDDCARFQTSCDQACCNFPPNPSRAVRMQHANSLGEVSDADPSPSPRRPVSHEDLAAHITAIRRSYVRATGSDASADDIAQDLLAEYSITK